MLKQWARAPALFSLTQNWGEGLQRECLCVFVFTQCGKEVKTENLNSKPSPSSWRCCRCRQASLAAVLKVSSHTFCASPQRVFLSNQHWCIQCVLATVCAADSCSWGRECVHSPRANAFLFFLMHFQHVGLSLQRVSSWQALRYRRLKWKLWVAAFHPFDSLLRMLLLLLGNEPKGL